MSGYLSHLCALLAVYILLAASLDLAMGYAGILAVVHAGLFGVGAFATAQWLLHGLDFFSGLLVAATVTSIVSLALSLPARQLTNDGVTLFALAAQTVLVAAFENWTSVTGGTVGLFGIPRPSLFGWIFRSPESIACLYLVITAICFFVLLYLKNGVYGRLLIAMRDSDLAARSLGINTRLLRIEVLAVSAAVAGIAGGMYAAYSTYLDETSFTLDASLVFISMVVVGGLASNWGALIGSGVLIAVPELLRWISIPSSNAATLRAIVLGLLLSIFVVLRPQGIVGTYRLGRTRV